MSLSSVRSFASCPVTVGGGCQRERKGRARRLLTNFRGLGRTYNGGSREGEVRTETGREE